MSTRQEALLVRREYNKWVANETLEDYALRYTAKRARRWSNTRVANTALGIVSFLALEAIGGAITLSFGFTNAAWAIVVVSAIIFLSGLPISYYAAKYGLDIDLLTRGAGFGYIGSTLSSLIYASFTFIFFAIEAAIMSMAIHLVSGLPLSLSYIISALAVIPLVTHGIRRISQFQAWTQPVWLVLQVLPLVFIALHESDALAVWTGFTGARDEGGGDFNLLYFGAAAAVIFPLIAQNGEQADFLRFLPSIEHGPRRWWTSVVLAGPGWVLVGMIKLFLGSFLAVLALKHGVDVQQADDPTHMYAVAFSYITQNSHYALWVAGTFVIISQLKINVTNAYAGSIAWGNFFSRLTHNHPGRVVWLFFNVSIALLLMELGLYQAFEQILITYATLVVAWIGALVADLVINKPLGLSPRHIEFRRSHLYDINPVGVGSMLIASGLGIAANLGQFGPLAESLAAFIALITPFVSAPLIAWLTGGRYYLCRGQTDEHEGGGGRQQCRLCENSFEAEDMTACPSYKGPICSLCCALDSRCGDVCRPKAHLGAQVSGLLGRLLPSGINEKLHSTTAGFIGIFVVTSLIIAALLTLVYFSKASNAGGVAQDIRETLWQVYFLLMLVTGVLVWLYVLAQRSARFSLSEAQMHARLLEEEVRAHQVTAMQLKASKEAAEAANSAKSRYLSGVSHELRTPLNTIFGYSQLLEGSADSNPKERKIASVIRVSAQHLSDVIEGLLEISKIEARRLDIRREKTNIKQLIEQLEDMFRPIAEAKNITFRVTYLNAPPSYVSADEKRLRQILLNLISNAIKFTPRGEVRLDISYRSEVARFIVTDTGVGIKADDQTRIFEPFVRVRDPLTQNISGTGLGLAISKLIVDLMGGDIELSSRPGKGSRFVLSLMLPGLSVEYNEEQFRRPVIGYEGPRRRIMVVDDEPHHRSLMQDLLGPLGFDVTGAASGETCLRALESHAFDLFLLDVSMPDMNGWQLARKIRGRGEKVPVIMISAESVPPHQAECHYSAYIAKPVCLDDLLENIRDCLGIEWVYESPVAAPGREVAYAQSRAGFDPGLLGELQQHARIGYLSGVVDAVNRLESMHGGSEFLAHVRLLAEVCDMDGIVKAINNLEYE